jgi:hypothetical protein
VVDGFHIGIALQRDDVAVGFARIEDNTVLNARTYGMYLSGNDVTVEGNHVDHVLGNSSASGPVGMLLTSGHGFVVRDNAITDIRPQLTLSSGTSTGLYLYDIHDSVIEGNTLVGITGHTGYGVYGIISTPASSGLSLNRNLVATPPAPGTPPYDGGQYFAILLQGTDSVCRDNVTGHFNTDISGCTKAQNDEY